MNTKAVIIIDIDQFTKREFYGQAIAESICTNYSRR